MFLLRSRRSGGKSSRTFTRRSGGRSSLPTFSMRCGSTGALSVGGVGRPGIPGWTRLDAHGSLWIGFLGGAIAARDGRLLSIGAVTGWFPEAFRKPASVFAASVSASVSLLLAYAGVTLVRIEWAG